MNHYNENEIENLPYKANRAYYLTEKYGNMWNTRFDYRPGGWDNNPERNPYHLIDLILKKYVNKPFNDLYSEWSYRCKKHDLLMQYKNLIHRSWIFSTRYYVDDDGILRYKIRKSKGKRKKIVSPKEYYENIDRERLAKRLSIPKEYSFKPVSSEQT